MVKYDIRGSIYLKDISEKVDQWQHKKIFLIVAVNTAQVWEPLDKIPGPNCKDEKRGNISSRALPQGKEYTTQYKEKLPLPCSQLIKAVKADCNSKFLQKGSDSIKYQLF